MITKTSPEVLTTQKELFMSTLNEYQKRQYLGTEALALGKRGVDKVSQFFGVRKTQFTVPLMKSILVILLNQDAFVYLAEDESRN